MVNSRKKKSFKQFGLDGCYLCVCVCGREGGGGSALIRNGQSLVSASLMSLLLGSKNTKSVEGVSTDL